MGPGEDRSGTAIDFDQARAGFEAAWRQILPSVSEVNFQEWRDQRDVAEICDVDAGRTDAFPEAEFDDWMPLRGEVRQPRSGGQL